MLYQTKVCFQTLIESPLCQSSPCLLIKLVCVPSLVSAISWLSLFRTSSIILPQLTGKGRIFLWLPEHQEEFDQLKKILSGSLVVDSSRPVVLLTDASRLFGLGYALGHIKHDKDNKPIFKIVHCGSKGLTPTQQCYSTINPLRPIGSKTERKNNIFQIFVVFCFLCTVNMIYCTVLGMSTTQRIGNTSV